MLNSLILLQCEKLKFSSVYIFTMLCLLFLPVDSLQERYFNKDEYIAKVFNEKSLYLTIGTHKNNISEKDRVLFISNLVNPFVVKMNRYEYFDINIVNTNGDVRKREDFINLVTDNNCDFVYIFRVFKEVVDHYADLFPNQTVDEDTLYKVVRKKDKILLEKVS